MAQEKIASKHLVSAVYTVPCNVEGFLFAYFVLFVVFS